jgi:AraC-like DNA-binding protein
MHAQPGEHWTVDRLGSAVGMSRTAFVQWFRRHVRSAPIEYLAHWRMAIVWSPPRHSDESLTEIAA